MKKLIFKLLRFSGLPLVFRELLQKNKITILLFHDISGKTAEQTFSYLRKKYNIIDLNDFVDSYYKKEKKAFPAKSLIITFDDGHIRNYEILPIIKKHNIPVTIFLCASIINTKRHYWFKYKDREIITSELKYKSNEERLKILSKHGFLQENEFENAQALTLSQINEMKKFVNFQAHTAFHPILPKCDDDEARIEIVDSKKTLENYGLHINTIAYPNGDYSSRDIELSKEAGYKCGITVDFGFNTLDSDIFKLKRLSVNDTEDINELIVKASGVWAFLKTRNGKKQSFGYK
ncbi:MAG: polysaccharide deacetylase family protein [Bacteroidota bacterium]